jgi:hypothetical protein
MKKSVVILIALIYAASIVLVGYLGLKAKTYNDVFPVERLEILTEYQENAATGDKYIIFNSNGSGDNTIQFECRVLPDTATDKGIIYKLANDCTIATISDDGLLTFTTDEISSLTVYIYANQNPVIQEEITVYFIP